MNHFLPGLSFEEYVALDGINVSSLTHMAVSPKHYRHYLDAGRPETPSFQLGRDVHCALLEPERFIAEQRELINTAAVWTGKVRNGKAWDEFKLANAHRPILTQKEFDELANNAGRVHMIRESVLADPIAARYLQAPGRCELSAQWADAETGLGCKARFDKLLDARILVDLKTSRHALPKPFGRQAAALSYHVRMAFYCDGIAARTGEAPPAVILAVESAPPYDVTVYPVPDEALDAGRRVYRGLLERVAECLEADHWPGCSGGREVPLELPQWAYEAGISDSLIIDGEEVSFA